MKIASFTVGATPKLTVRPVTLCCSAAIAFAAVMGCYPAVQAADFNFTYAPGVSLEQMLGFEMAGEIWADYLVDNATINIFVETTDILPDNVIGGALPGIKAQQSYWQFQNQVAADRTSSDDYTAYHHMEKGSTYKAWFDLYTNNINQGDEAATQTIDLTRANAKALGLLSGDSSGLDGYILINSLEDESVDWNYNFQASNAPNGTLDYLSVALHEIGHVLGFVSGVDRPGWLDSSVSSSQEMQAYTESLDTRITHATPLDMFRYNPESRSRRVNDLSLGGEKFFSIDKGQTEIAYLATGEDNSLGGDGYQASHWQKQDTHLGIMDPVLEVGQRRQLSDLDQLAMDVIGWDLQSGEASLATLYSQSLNQLAQKMGVTVEWMAANSDLAALLLTPTWLDTDNNNLDDRGELLNQMVVSSEVYEWGWGGYWWGWGGYWWGWGGYWQERGDLDTLGDLSQQSFWQNFSWQTVDLPTTDLPTTDTPIKQTQTTAASVPEPSSVLGLLGLGLLSLGSWRRRGDRSNQD